MKYFVFLMVLLVASIASANWSDNFDSYTSGSGLAGQGGWVTWDNDPGADALVSSAYHRSGANSAEIAGTSDMVQEFNIMSGQATISGWCLVPAGSTGKQYFILLTVYDGSNSDWALDMFFDTATDLVGTEEGTATASIVYNEWVEVKVEIDLDADSQSIYYGGSLLETLPWSPTSQVYQFDAIDLFGNNASPIYWDDFDLTATSMSLTPGTWASIKSSF